jgi:hypothetical protein
VLCQIVQKILSSIQKPAMVTRPTRDNNNNNNNNECKELGIEVPDNWYSYVPKPVCEHKDITELWNQDIKTNREVLANRPDIIIKKKNLHTNICINTIR